MVELEDGVKELTLKRHLIIIERSYPFEDEDATTDAASIAFTMSCIWSQILKVSLIVCYVRDNYGFKTM